MGRILVIDSLRGIAIMVMLVFHCSYYWNSPLTVEDYNARLQNPLAMAFMVLGKFAGIFAIISAMVYTISITEKKHRDNKEYTSNTILTQTSIAGLSVIILGKIQSAFFNHTHTGYVTDPYPTGPKYYTLITGSIQTGRLQIPSTYIYLYRNTALILIGISIIIVGVFLSILYRNNGQEKIKRTLGISFILGTVFIVIAQFMKTWLRPYWVAAVIDKNVIPAIFLGFLVGDSFPVFPFAGYALYGIDFGLIFAHQIDRRKVNGYIGIVAIVYFISGIVLYSIQGSPDIRTIQETPNAPLNFMQISFMLFVCLLIYNIHHMNDKSSFKQSFISESIRRFGLMTLTIFMFEPLLGNILKVIILDPLFPHWSTNIIYPVLYGVFLLVLWHYILKIWESKQFWGSWEWINGHAISHFTKTTPSRQQINDNLHF